MRLYKVVVLVNLALAIGFIFGSLWWEREVSRPRRELAVARRANILRQAGERSWSVKGVVRVMAPEVNLIFITHEEVPGRMEAMTMGFEVTDAQLLDELDSGDAVRFTLQEKGGRLRLVAIEKQGGP